MKLWMFSTDISLPQSERLEAKWLHINLPDLSIQPEGAGNFTNPAILILNLSSDYVF